MKNTTSLSGKLTKLRLNKQVSMEYIADTIDISRAQYWQLETGNSTNPTLRILIKLAKFFEVTVGYLIGEEDNREDILIWCNRYKALSKRDKKIINAMMQEMKTLDD